MQTSIILNEREFAESAIERNSLGTSPFETLSSVAKYYHADGYKKSEISSMLEDFILKCDPTARIPKWQDRIDKAVNGSSKYKLINVDGVYITQSEIDICAGLAGKQAQRLMFTLICLAKLANAINEDCHNWVNKRDKEIFKLANIITPIKRQSLMLNDLMQEKLIRFSKCIDNTNINVCCLDYNGQPLLHITDFRNLGYQYLRYCGEPYFECSCCGIVTRKKSVAQKYCSDCAHTMKLRLMAEQYHAQKSVDGQAIS